MTTLDIIIAGNTYDGDEINDTTYEVSGWDSDGARVCGLWGGNRSDIGLIFQSVTVPIGATITTAYLRGYHNFTGGGNPEIIIKGYDEDSPAAFTSTTRPSQRTKLGATVSQNCPAGVGTYVNFAEMKTIVQAIIERAGWVSGANMGFSIEENAATATYRAQFGDYNYDAAKAFILHIEYTVPAPPPPATPGSFAPDVWVEILTTVDGLPVWTNIGGDIVSPIKCNLGFSDGDVLSRLAPGSDMRFDLFNPTGTYDPSSTFYKAQKIRLRVQYGSLVKTKFFGYIDHIGLDVGTWGARQVHVVAIDWLALAAKTPVRALAGMTNTRIDLAVASLLAQMQVQPEALDFEIGDITLPSVFDQVTPNSTVYSELQNLVMGEWGYIYMRDGGQTLKIENSLSRTGDGADYKTTGYYLPDGVAEDFLLEDGSNFLLEDGTNFLLEGEPTAGSFTSDLDEEYTDVAINHGDALTNKISASAVPVVIGGSTLVLYPFDIATGSKAFLVPTNTALNPFIFQGQYKDPTAGGAQISGSSVVTPVLTTDWKFNSLPTGLGTDLSGNITITFTAGQSGFKAVIVNSGAAGYFTKFNVRGIPVYRYAPVETTYLDQRSIWDYGDYSLQFTRQYGQSSDDIRPFMFRLLMRDRKPRTIVSNPKFNAFDEINHLAGFLALDIGDQIRLASTKPASDALYYIQGCKFTIQPGSEAITFDYVTTETLAASIAGVTESAVEFSLVGFTPAGGERINFRALSVISNLSQRTISFRIKNNDPADTSARWLFGYGANGGVYKEATAAHGNARILFTRGGATAGTWRTGYVVGFGAWVNVLITFDQTLVTNDPIIYIAGASSAITEVSTPVLPYTDEALLDFAVGSLAADGYNSADGLLQNLAIYNRIVSSTEIATIQNGGVRLPFASYPQNGLKFFFAGVDNETYAAKLDDALGTLDTVYDLVNGFTGQPINSPILRAVG
jgi:hypothetical protein